MYNDFDYEEALNQIKSSLFDIYESQEIIVGSIENDEERNKHVQKYIETKNLAVKLVENITALYSKPIMTNKDILKISEIQQAEPVIIKSVVDNGEEIEKNDTISNQEVIDNNEEKNIEDNDFSEEEFDSGQKEVEETSLEDATVIANEEDDTISSKEIIDSNEEKNIEDNDFSEEEFDSDQKEVEETSLEDGDDTFIVNEDKDKISNKESNYPKFYLDNRNGSKPNFAYVPEKLYLKIKSNAITSFDNNKIYKQDTEKRRGIIVRNDQFMKLSLSRHRQEGVLHEAKEFRIAQAIKSRKKLQEEALEKGKVSINI